MFGAHKFRNVYLFLSFSLLIFFYPIVVVVTADVAVAITDVAVGVGDIVGSLPK